MPAPRLDPADRALHDLLYPGHGTPALQPVDAGIHDVAGHRAPHRASRAAESRLPCASRADLRDLEPKQATRLGRRAAPGPEQWLAHSLYPFRAQPLTGQLSPPDKRC